MYSARRTTADMDLHGREGTQQAPKGRYVLDAVSFVTHVYRRHYVLQGVHTAGALPGIVHRYNRPSSLHG